MLFQLSKTIQWCTVGKEQSRGQIRPLRLQLLLHIPHYVIIGRSREISGLIRRYG